MPRTPPAAITFFAGACASVAPRRVKAGPAAAIGYDWVGTGDSMENKQREWPALYDRMRGAAEARGLIPFLTELGASHDWEAHNTDLRPDVYGGSQTRAYMDLQMQQADRQVLNWTYWNYNLYNDADSKDGWNLENFSLLGPGRQPRHVDIISRPYPMRSSAQPRTAFFDLGSKYFALIRGSRGFANAGCQSRLDGTAHSQRSGPSGPVQVGESSKCSSTGVFNVDGP